MRTARSEHLLLLVLLAVPLAIAFIGWPAFARWAVGPGPQPTPEVAGAAATSVATAEGARPTAQPTIGAPPTIQPRAVATRPAPAQPTTVAANTPEVAAATATPPQDVTSAAVRTPAGGASTDDPSAAVQDFYARVTQHDFASAAALWTPRMRSAFPPQENIDARFSQTRSITVRRAEVVSESQSGDQASVAVDLVETAATGQHHWSGSWQVVRGPSGWLLDEPRLQPD
jgi:hypothetical protein